MIVCQSDPLVIGYSGLLATVMSPLAEAHAALDILEVFFPTMFPSFENFSLLAEVMIVNLFTWFCSGYSYIFPI